MKNTNDDSLKRIINSVTLADRPPGVSTLDWLCDRYEREECRPRTVKAAIRAKIEAFEVAQRAKEAKTTAASITAFAIRPTSVSRSSTRSTPGAAASPAYPHLARLESLSGTEATAFYREHRRAIVAEDFARKQAIAAEQAADNRRAAKSGRGFTL